MENKEAIELLEKTIDDFMSYFEPRGGISEVPLGPFERAKETLALLKPCPTCGGSKRIPNPTYGLLTKTKTDIIREIPCPECAEEPESQEPGLAESDYMSIEQREKFEAKNIPEKAETSSVVIGKIRAIINRVADEVPKGPVHSVCNKDVLWLCDRLEAAEKENKRLTENALGTIKEIEGDLFVDVVDPVCSLSVLAIGQAEEIKQLKALKE